MSIKSSTSTTGSESQTSRSTSPHPWGDPGSSWDIPPESTTWEDLEVVPEYVPKEEKVTPESTDTPGVPTVPIGLQWSSVPSLTPLNFQSGTSQSVGGTHVHQLFLFAQGVDGRPVAVPTGLTLALPSVSNNLFLSFRFINDYCLAPSLEGPVFGNRSGETNIPSGLPDPGLFPAELTPPNSAERCLLLGSPTISAAALGERFRLGPFDLAPSRVDWGFSVTSPPSELTLGPLQGPVHGPDDSGVATLRSHRARPLTPLTEQSEAGDSAGEREDAAPGAGQDGVEGGAGGPATPGDGQDPAHLGRRNLRPRGRPSLRRSVRLRRQGPDEDVSGTAGTSYPPLG